MRLDAAFAARLNGAGPVGVAVSGGGDSLALLCLLAAWGRRPLHVFCVDHGIHPDSAMWTRRVGAASNNWKIEAAVRDIQESIRQGKSFAAPLAKADVFPAMVPQMVSVGEESGTLVEMLASIADFYEDEVETATSQLSATIEPLLIVVLGIVIGGMVISLYLPIFTLYQDISAQ